MPQFEEITLGKVTRGRKTSVVLAVAVFVAHFLMFRSPSVRAEDALLTLLALPFTQALGVAGWRVFHASVLALAALLYFVFLHRLTSQRWLAAVGSAVLVLNPLVLAFPFPNSGSVALLASSALLASLFARPRRPFVSGGFAGLIVAVSPSTVLFLPVLWAWVALAARDIPAKPTRRMAMAREVAWALGGTILVALPALLLWSGLLVVPGDSLGDSGRSVLADTFSMDTLLNYPFYKHLVRTPHFPFPAFLYLLLVLVKAFGLVMIVVMILGVLPAWRSRNGMSALMAGSFLGVYLFWAFREDLTVDRLTHLFLVLPALVFFLVHGLELFGRLALAKRNVLLLLFWGMGLYFGLKVTYFLEFSQDLRWYGRHQVARPALVEKTELKAETQQVQSMPTVESPAEHRMHKAVLTEGSPLPSWVFPPEWQGTISWRSLLSEWQHCD